MVCFSIGQDKKPLDFQRSFGHRTKEMLQCVERTSTERSGNGESYTVYHYDRPFAFFEKTHTV